MQTTTAVKLERIVAAVDFSPASKRALRSAVRFANWFSAELALLHVVERIGLGMDNEALLHRDHAEAQIKLARKNLQALSASLPLEGARKVESLIRHGLAPHQIVEGARDCDADLIVLASHSYPGWQHLHIGSTAEQVVRSAHCPVLAVRATRAREGKPQRILVPTDFSTCAQEGIDYAIALAHHIDCEVVLLTVLPPDGAHDRTAAQEKLLALAAFDDTISTAIRHGYPPNEICQAAIDLKADLIVIATHGKTSWQHFCLGSTSEAVVHAARCPVLVVREKEHELI